MLLLSSTILCTHSTSTTLFPVLRKQSVSVPSFEYLTDNSNIMMGFHVGKCVYEMIFKFWSSFQRIHNILEIEVPFVFFLVQCNDS
jgi:hypothetical protein